MKKRLMTLLLISAILLGASGCTPVKSGANDKTAEATSAVQPSASAEPAVSVQPSVSVEPAGSIPPSPSAESAGSSQPVASGEGTSYSQLQASSGETAADAYTGDSCCADGTAPATSAD